MVEFVIHFRFDCCAVEMMHPGDRHRCVIVLTASPRQAAFLLLRERRQTKIITGIQLSTGVIE